MISVPERPADIKALPVDNSSILVSWKSPLHSNGILTRYNVYITGGTYKVKKYIHSIILIKNYISEIIGLSNSNRSKTIFFSDFDNACILNSKVE